MKKSELLARYWCYGEDIIPITEEEFDTVLADAKNLDTIETFELMPDNTCMSVVQDNYRYYSFTADWFPTRIQGEHDIFSFKLFVGNTENAIPTEF